MSNRGPILCATDLGSAGARAVELAAEMANAMKKPLVLAHVTGPGPGGRPPANEAERVLQARLKTRIDAAAAALDKERKKAEELGPRTETKLLVGRPWEEIVVAATDTDASMVVVGSHGAAGPFAFTRGELTEHVLGTTADRVVRHAPCPVLVAPRHGAEHPKLTGGRWLVGIDFSDSSRAALRLAHELSKACNAELLPFHVVSDVVPEPSSDDPLQLERAADDPIAVAHAAELRQLVRDELDVDLEVQVALGRPSAVIARAAEALDANLIVMGTRGRTGLAHLLLGSVVERTLRRASVPVLCTRAA